MRVASNDNRTYDETLPGEKKLFWEIINRAIMDAGIKITSKGSKVGRPPAPPDEIYRDSARRFLTDTRGDWALARQEICELSGLNPNKIRELTLVALNRKDSMVI